MNEGSCSLDAQINDYLLTASGHLNESKSGGKGRQLAAFGAAASSALVMISQAEAAVVLNGGDTPPFEVVNGIGTFQLPGFTSYGFRQFDMDGDGNNDFAVWGYTPGGNNGMAVAFGPYSSSNALFGGGSDDLPKLSAGFTLGPALPSASWTNSVMYTGNDVVDSLGNGAGLGWTGGVNERGFIGARFETAEGTHYGWICLQSDPTDGSPSVSVVAYAYESTPDTPIQVGATGSGTFACDEVDAPLPAPAMGPLGMGLAALALGGAGLAGLRRRRESRTSDGSCA